MDTPGSILIVTKAGLSLLLDDEWGAVAHRARSRNAIPVRKGKLKQHPPTPVAAPLYGQEQNHWGACGATG